mgnify:CR=1 FL=1
MNEIAALPSLSELLSQNPNMQANASIDRFMQSSEMGSDFGSEFVQNAGNGAAAGPVIDVAPVNRVTAPGFADMFEKFIKGVDRKKAQQDYQLAGLERSIRFCKKELGLGARS